MSSSTKRLRLFALAGLLALLGTACGDLFDAAAAVVYDEKITIEEVDQAVDGFRDTKQFQELAGQGDVQAVTRQFEQGYLATIVRRLVLSPKAAELGVEVTQEDVDEQVDAIKADFPSEAAFEEALEEQGLDLAQLEDLVRDRLLEDRIRAEVTKDAGPSETELRAYYDEHIEDYEETRAAHILVDKETLAVELAATLQAAPAGKVDQLFARLARRHSTDGSAQQGGDLGYNPAGSFVPAFEEAMNRLAIGEVSDPVKTEFGWHVIRVTDRRTKPFEAVADEIGELLAGDAQEKAFSDWIKQAYEDAEVRVNPRYGELDLATGNILDSSAEDVPGGEAPAEEPTAEATAPPAPGSQ